VSEERCWLAVVEEPPAGAFAWAALDEGFLVAWMRPSRPVREARRADPRIVDVAGEEGWCSLVLPERDRLPLFDDVAVQQARRAVLAGPAPDALSTLLIDNSHFAGAVTVRRGVGAPALLRDDPFARLGGRVARVGAGLFGRLAAPTGPGIERHGSGQPWPWDRFGE
jgi:hypothetical protein